MQPRTRMRISPAAPKIAWKTMAVDAQDPLAFAQELERSLQEMTDGGYVLMQQMPRGSALVLVGHRIETGVSATAATVPPPSPPRRRVVDTSSPRGQEVEEYVYNYFEHKTVKSQTFSSMVEALRVVREHISTEHMVPISITMCSMTRFDLEALPALLKSFSEELKCTPLG